MDLYVDDFDRISNIKNEKLKQIFRFPRGHWITAFHETKTFHSLSRFLKRCNGLCPILVVYLIPKRDLGNHSIGGVNSNEQYELAINCISEAVGDKDAIVILEPDALAHAVGHEDLLKSRINLLNSAVNVFNSKCKNVKLYVDVGHPRWHSSELMYNILRRLVGDYGVSINVSNFVPTGECITYGIHLGKRFVIDTSRNGNLSYDTFVDGWCNPANRKIGLTPMWFSTSMFGALDGFLWIKVPGESDGQCNGGPKAGAFFTQYAEELVKNLQL